jgi:uncharacterized protein (TIGR03437 family)
MGGKAGTLYLVNYDSMGHLGPDTTSTVQSAQVAGAGLFDMALWSQAPNGPVVYEYDVFNALKAFQITNNKLNSTILSQFTPANASVYAGVSISANGGKNGIVWLTTGNQNASGDPATLHALDANNLANELWNSDGNGARDQPGSFTKFAPPTVVNGRVYVPTVSNGVAVYGTPLAAETGGTPAISAIVNSASFLEGAIAPGELVTIFGANLGPVTDEQGTVIADVVGNSIGNTQVLIGGSPAPILYASSTQINVIVPFGVTGTTAQIEVMNQSQAIASAMVSVQAASPAIFSAKSTGGGQGAILNQDGSVNTHSNPASSGSVVSLFATGAGLTTPASADGFVTAAPYPTPNLPVSVTIDGANAEVVYAGAAPGLVAGVLQVNVIVPADTPAVSYNQVVLTIGDYSSPSAVTLTVH